MIPVILSGGSGSRLWPLSRQSSPKQFLALHTQNTLFQETLMRLNNIGLDAPIIVCNDAHRFTVANNIDDISYKAQDIILEPMGRNTAPAIAVAALVALKNGDDPVIAVLPADHTIEDEGVFGEALKLANNMAEKGYLVTFGITPTEAHTGYGYIEVGEALESKANKVSSFVEKPNEKKAKALLEGGQHLWNSGMFCFKASVYLEELKKFQPEMVVEAKNSLTNAQDDFEFTQLNRDDFEKCNDISIDYAVMEKTDKACVIAINTQWNDIGSWDAVWEVSEKDSDNNICTGDVINRDSKDSFIYSPDKLLVTLGVEDMIVVNTPDAVLVADKSRTQDVKNVVDILKKNKRKEVQYHNRVDRPWGYYDLLHEGTAAEVRRLVIKPDAQIVLQKHQKRSEHWVVVKGQAEVIKDDTVQQVKQNESIYIAAGVAHSLKNNGDIDLEIIEIRTGDYLGEDDVVRIGG